MAASGSHLGALFRILIVLVLLRVTVIAERVRKDGQCVDVLANELRCCFDVQYMDLSRLKCTVSVSVVISCVGNSSRSPVRVSHKDKAGQLSSTFSPRKASARISIGVLLTLLAVSGDIELNPGPTCCICDANGRRNQLVIACDACNISAHKTCAKLSREQLNFVKKTGKWTCWSCSLPQFSSSFFDTTVSSTQDSNIYLDKVRRGRLTCLSFNARSLKNRKKYPVIQAWVESIDPAVIFVCETWLNDSISDSEILPDSYTVFRHDRMCTGSTGPRRGGGVLLAVRPTLQPVRMTTLERDAEIVWVSIVCGTRKILLGSAYRAPNCENDVNNALLDSIQHVQEVQHEYDGIYLCGDFNLEIQWNSTDYISSVTGLAEKFMSAFLSVVPHQLVTEATRITKSTRPHGH
jgi:hypothetical protein